MKWKDLEKEYGKHFGFVDGDLVVVCHHLFGDASTHLKQVWKLFNFFDTLEVLADTRCKMLIERCQLGDPELMEAAVVATVARRLSLFMSDPDGEKWREERSGKITPHDIERVKTAMVALRDEARSRE